MNRFESSPPASSSSSPPAVSPARAAARLDGRQIAVLAAWGVLLWFCAALVIRFAPPVVFGRGAWTALIYAAAAPVAWLTVLGTRRVASLRPGQVVAGTAVGSAAAMLCDGIALPWSPLYGADRDLAVAAAWLLWGVAAILVAALVAERLDARPGDG